MNDPLSAPIYIVKIKLFIGTIYRKVFPKKEIDNNWYPLFIKAQNSNNYTQCDSLLIGNDCGAHTVPYINVRNELSDVAHEATTSKISEEQLYYCRQRGINEEDATALIVNGFCREVLKNLPMEFAVEAKKLLELSLEGAVG